MMLGEFEKNIDDTDITFRDMISLMLFGFVILFMIIISHINPVGKKENDAEIVMQGDISFELFWTDNIDADLDLWFKTPKDIPVGYTNKSGKYGDLLRDDLGRRNDPTPYNREISLIRGLLKGEYIVNVHCYRCPEEYLPIDYNLVITIKYSNKENKIINLNGKLKNNREEITVHRFYINGSGRYLEIKDFKQVKLVSRKFK